MGVYWKKYVHLRVDGGEALWFANKVARELMDDGVLPPSTGSQTRNQYWWTIDPQLVNEIWSAFYPGMLDQAVRRAEWGAKITSSSWGTHPTMFYAALYSAAFFESNVTRLYDIAMHYIDETSGHEASPFLAGLWDVRDLHAKHPDNWQHVRQIIKARYLEYPSDCLSISTSAGCPSCPSSWNTCWVSAMINGLHGAIALIYGDGDFMKTVGTAIAAGFDCDNQAATLAGLLGVVHGSSQIPKSLTHYVAGNNWTRPFNNRYINERRLPLPGNNTISEIVSNITNIARSAILQHDGWYSTSASTGVFSVQVSQILTQAMGPPARQATVLASGASTGVVGISLSLCMLALLVQTPMS